MNLHVFAFMTHSWFHAFGLECLIYNFFELINDEITDNFLKCTVTAIANHLNMNLTTNTV